VSAIAESIWQVPAYLPYLQPALTKRAVTAVEKAIGHKLPGEYLDLLKVQNGGYIRYSLPEYPHSKIKGIGPHFPALKAEDWEEDQEYVSFPLDGLVPFDGDGHWHLCLDYRLHADCPGVAFISIEGDNQSPVAPSFAEYLSLLEPPIPTGYVIDPVGDIGTVIAALSTALRITFEPPSSWENGYPVHRARLGSERNPEWVWINPNKVPRGFVRTEDPRYHELKTLLPGTTLSFPELPPDCYLLDATEKVRNRVLSACAKSGIAVRPAR
jgi:hypothetical protein